MEKVTLTQEIWKDVIGYENSYKASNKGRIKRLAKDVVSTPQGHIRHYPESIVKEYVRPNGYKYVELSKGGKAKKHSVHRLVATAFVSNEGGNPQVNHIDGVKANNSANNLEWVTAKDNIKHAYKNKLRPKFHKGRSVIQIDINGNEINKFKSINKASIVTGVDYSSIVRTCEGRYKQAGGYLWKFAEDRKDIN